MPAPGANMKYGNSARTWARIVKKFGLSHVGGGSAGRKSATQRYNGAADDGTAFPRRIAICCKAGAPATNTAADAPTGEGDLCYDETNDDVYRCSAYTNTTTFTWTKIVD